MFHQFSGHDDVDSVFAEPGHQVGDVAEFVYSGTGFYIDTHVACRFE